MSMYFQRCLGFSLVYVLPKVRITGERVRKARHGGVYCNFACQHQQTNQKNGLPGKSCETEFAMKMMYFDTEAFEFK